MARARDLPPHMEEVLQPVTARASSLAMTLFLHSPIPIQAAQV